ncbi:dTDP-glucose 4,6-dehydratase [Peribacillus sp. FSL H8-0477]|uniref:dTDP-glucose 4,6-dehydratase n=1 Tax=Peribacillus sp. FSL H8-0477 TaxID=2921388 RepID=UPI0030F5E37D
MVKKKVLITGGAGFIGGNFVHYILNKYPEYEIVNLDALTYAGELTKHQVIENLPNYHFTQIDITDNEQLSNLFIEKEFDYVIHFAAESHVDRSIANPEQFILTNVLGTQNLLQAAKQTKISKFIHISTDEVYGELDFDKTNFFTETTPLQPNSPYSASKASSDLLVRAYAETYQLPVNITRCSNNYGPFQFPEKLIPLTISKILNDKKVPIYGNGLNIRDWLHVYDHCTAIDVILHKGINGEVYNIGGHNEKTNLDVVKTIIHTIGKSEKLIEHVEDRLGHDKRYAIDPTKLEQLGWKPTYTFETGIHQTIDWYIKNKQWLNHVLSENK